MQALGLDPLIAPIEMTQGVGSANVPTHFVNITIDMQGVVQFPVYAGFTTGLDAMGMGLLGQTGFFERFNIHLKQAQKTCFIEIPDPPAPAAP